jgi:hypothetical protein
MRNYFQGMTISAWLHWLIYNDASMSICGRAWERRHDPFWAMWVKVFGKRHCRESWWWHRLR